MAQARGKLESDEVLEGREFLVIKELAYVAVEGLAGFTDDTIGSCNEPTSKLEDGLRFLRNWTNAFIIRDPAEQIPSLVHQLRRAHPDPSTYSLLHESGSGALHRLFHFVTGTLGQKAIVIEASVLRKDPKGLLKRFCAETGIEFRDDMLEWDENGGIRKGLEGWLLIVRFSQRGDPALGNLVEAWMA